MEKELAGQIAIVTGSDSGIGQGIAVEFARQGAAVLVHYLHDENGAMSTLRQIEALGGKAVVVQADITVADGVERIFLTCDEKLGMPTILVNSAGIDARGEKIEDLSVESFQKAISTNLIGPFMTCRLFVMRLKKAKEKGRIINISSVHQDIPRAGAVDYDCSKGGIRNLTTTLALELAPDKINVNGIAPGMILTPMNQRAIDDPKELEKQVQSVPWKRAGEPWEV
ncbi:MAG: SDR family NAD(P)-dependent oxidoreductase, partial [Candidatus Eremiobacteraeota bacterium]|nr:SDR family NAD(P)-dependent oxidoreductase [Candidatus Eremiobacteraeota bacterium]